MLRQSLVNRKTSPLRLLRFPVVGATRESFIFSSSLHDKIIFAVRWMLSMIHRGLIRGFLSCVYNWKCSNLVLAIHFRLVTSHLLLWAALRSISEAIRRTCYEIIATTGQISHARSEQRLNLSRLYLAQSERVTRWSFYNRFAEQRPLKFTPAELQ